MTANVKEQVILKFMDLVLYLGNRSRCNLSPFFKAGGLFRKFFGMLGIYDLQVARYRVNSCTSPNHTTKKYLNTNLEVKQRTDLLPKRFKDVTGSQMLT
jgi:hypothetical protein